MKIKTDYAFPEQYRIIAEEYISYKRSIHHWDEPEQTSLSWHQ